jgi:hypothetical protein
LLDVLSFGRCNIDALTLNNFFKIFLGWSGLTHKTPDPASWPG